jgi:hypothetical protein
LGTLMIALKFDTRDRRYACTLHEMMMLHLQSPFLRKSHFLRVRRITSQRLPSPLTRKSLLAALISNTASFV